MNKRIFALGALILVVPFTYSRINRKNKPVVQEVSDAPLPTGQPSVIPTDQQQDSFTPKELLIEEEILSGTVPEDKPEQPQPAPLQEEPQQIWSRAPYRQSYHYQIDLLWELHLILPLILIRKEKTLFS